MIAGGTGEKEGEKRTLLSLMLFLGLSESRSAADCVLTDADCLIETHGSAHMHTDKVEWIVSDLLLIKKKAQERV